MNRWKIEKTPDGLRLLPTTHRTLGSQSYTWANLLYEKLALVRVYVIYFPSRFDLGHGRGIEATAVRPRRLAV